MHTYIHTYILLNSLWRASSSVHRWVYCYLVASCYGMAEKLTDISQLEEAFHLAAERITKNKTLKVGTDEKLKLYSYYKQVSII